MPWGMHFVHVCCLLILNATPDERLEGSLGAAVAAALAGANILRVHDVAETGKAVKIADAIRFGFPR